MTAIRQHGISWAGLAAGPAAWAISFQGNYLLVEWQCASKVSIVPFAALALAMVALLGSYLSWVSVKRPVAEASQSDHAHHFLAAIGSLMGALFAVAILLQAYAGYVFSGCER